MKEENESQESSDLDDEPVLDEDEELEPSEIPDLTQSMELVHRVKGGDSGALNELLDRYIPRLRRAIQLRMGPRLSRRYEPDDVLQDVYMVAMSRIHTLELRSPRSIKQWLIRIAENRLKFLSAHDKAQKRDADREAPLDTPSGNKIPLPSPDSTPSQRVARTEFQELIDNEVQKLTPPEYRDVIVLRDYEYKPWGQVTEELGRPTIRAAQELYRRAQIKLRQKVRTLIDDDAGT